MRCPRRVTRRKSLQSAVGRCRTFTERHIQEHLLVQHSQHNFLAISDGLTSSEPCLAGLLGAAPDMLIAVYLSSSGPPGGPNDDA